jgi:hypothetical protein
LTARAQSGNKEEEAMRNILKVAALLLCQGLTSAQAADVAISIDGQIKPGVYGRIDIGSRPPPPVVYTEPMVIVRQPRVVEPVYLHVPPGHARNWGKHCHRYRACRQPVYFVKSAEYEPGYGHKPKQKHKHKNKHKHEQKHHGKHGHGHGHH